MVRRISVGIWIVLAAGGCEPEADMVKSPNTASSSDATQGAAPSAEPSITGTRWILRKLAGNPAPLGAGGQAADVTLHGSEPRASGFAGCNQFTGGYTLEGNQLSFGKTAMTMRACADGMELEQDFAVVLRDTKGYRVERATLILLNEDGAVLAELSAE